MKATELLASLDRELAAAKRKREQISGDIQVETNRLVQERRTELAQLEDQAKARAKTLTDDIQLRKTELIALERRKLTLDGEIAGLQTTSVDLAHRIANQTQELSRLTRETDTKNTEFGQIDARIRFLETGITPLQDRQLELKTTIQELEQAELTLQTQIATLDSQFNTKQEQADRQISTLLQQYEQLQLEMAARRHEFDQVAETIATRTKALDAREETLKAREHKVSAQEQKVARVAGLMNL
jgi:chromosome segregation ATPase